MNRVDTPIRIGKFSLKNRITYAPTVKFDFTDDSALATQKHIDHYIERAKGGVGLICVEATAVTPDGRFGRNHMGLWDDAMIEGHKKIVDGCHEYGTIMIIQLNHTGYVSNPELGEHIGPSEIEMDGYRGKYTTKAMSIDEIHAMQKAFVDAAVRAKKAGYDGVQLHACHGYMINQFVSQKNLRTDEYGGSTENRARFATEIIKEIKAQCGEDFLVSARTTGCEPTVEEAIAIAEEYIKAGCDYLQVSHGMSSLDELPDLAEAPYDKLETLGVRFKKYFGDRIQVSAVGSMNTPDKVKAYIEGGLTDTVDVSRQILADPEFPNAVINGTPYVKCFCCKACQYGPFTAHKCPAEIIRNKAK